MCVRNVEKGMARRRHPKVRAIGRLGLVLVAAGLIGVSVVSWFVHFGVRWDLFHHDRRSRETVFVANGRIWLASQPNWIVDWEHDRLSVLGIPGVGVWSWEASANLPMTEPYFFGVDPYMDTNPFGGVLSIPYATGTQQGVYFSGLIAGTLVGLSTVPSWIGSFKRRYRAKHGCCRWCGYSLEGLESDRCPECGEGFDGEDHA